jgi:hypothetical protein
MMESHDEGESEVYLRSTAPLYAERNSGLRPMMIRPNVSSDHADMESGSEETAFSTFQITAKFRNLMNRFQQEFDHVFPDIPCAYCGYLLSSRTTCWLTAQEATREASAFELVTRLYLAIHQDSIGRVAICKTCRKKPRAAITAGPWPAVLLDIPKRSRPYLSPLKLNCSLGRTQSHSATSNYHNPWSTYRTLSGTVSSYSLYAN